MSMETGVLLAGIGGGFSAFEWWYVALAIVGVALPFGYKIHHDVRTETRDSMEQLSLKLDGFQESISARLNRMDGDFALRMTDLQAKFQHNEDRVHTLTLQVERRVTRLEARLEERTRNALRFGHHFEERGGDAEEN